MKTKLDPKKKYWWLSIENGSGCSFLHWLDLTKEQMLQTWANAVWAEHFLFFDSKGEAEAAQQKILHSPIEECHKFVSGLAKEGRLLKAA